ncbi:hypothetical protein [Gynuella sp.]|uniref:hypothetical protein n=1 Tax=Gynuella sp. TaxID=2969146 RepID=UPI003D0CE8B6
MKTKLTISALSCFTPDIKTHTNSLGSVQHRSYGHMLDKAGHQSRPSHVPRGVTTIRCDEYRTPTAETETRVGDLASFAVQHCLQNYPNGKNIKHLFHTQCTLDQRITASSCLQLVHEHFAPKQAGYECFDVISPVTIGQLATAGLPTVFRLADSVQHEGQICISASDKWIAPIARYFPNLVTYADAGAACIAGHSDHVLEPIATIEAVQLLCRPPGRDLWQTSAETQAEFIVDLVTACLDRLSKEMGGLSNDIKLIGDHYVPLVEQNIAAKSGFPLLRQPEESASHWSSASMLYSLSRAVEYAVETKTPQRIAIWTASPSGHAGVVLVRCSDMARKTESGWTHAQ